MVKVADCIMGTGKSSAAITYINEHPDDKFIYITPYLEQAARIKKNCPDLNFIEPSDKISEYQFKKSLHTVALIEEGKNITTTHQSFRGYSPETLEMIKEKGYSLIIDENLDVLEQFSIHPDDVQLAVDAGYIRENNGVFSIANTDYRGAALRDLFYTIRSRDLVKISDEDDGSDGCMFYWVLTPELILAFKDVFVLTYLFEAQSLHHLFEIYHIPYEYIGVHKYEDGTYHFGDLPGYTPDYLCHLKDMIHILDNKKMNEVGDDYYAMSKSWFERGDDGVEQLKKNVYNCYRNIWCDIPADRRMWGSYNGAFTKVRGKGYAKGFVTFNAKATNAYRDRYALVYIANVFMNANERRFYKMHGIETDQDIYALSVMVQWIWRSALRDGGEVLLYIPSRRMRSILENWINSFSEEEETHV